MVYWVLSRDFGYADKSEHRGFYLTKIKAENDNQAWEQIESDIATNNSQDWLLDKGQLKALKALLKKGV